MLPLCDNMAGNLILSRRVSVAVPMQVQTKDRPPLQKDAYPMQVGSLERPQNQNNLTRRKPCGNKTYQPDCFIGEEYKLHKARYIRGGELASKWPKINLEKHGMCTEHSQSKKMLVMERKPRLKYAWLVLKIHRPYFAIHTAMHCGCCW